MFSARITSPKKYEITDIDIPVIDDGMCLIQLEQWSVCGSDIRHTYGPVHPEEEYPMRHGGACHECAGTIVESKSEKFKVYDIVQALYKTKDRDFKIYALTGALKCKNNFMICKNYWDKIVPELSELFKNNAKIEEVGTEKHSADSSGKSKITSIYFNFDSGDYAYIEMMDWSKAMKYNDQLSVGFRTNEFGIWLSNKAYK